MPFFLRSLKMSGRRGSNPRPAAWKAAALPTELLPRITIVFYRDEKEQCYCSLQRNEATVLRSATLWGDKDLNLGTPKRTDLQSVAFDHLAISPRQVFRSTFKDNCEH